MFVLSDFQKATVLHVKLKCKLTDKLKINLRGFTEAP